MARNAAFTGLKEKVHPSARPSHCAIDISQSSLSTEVLFELDQGLVEALYNLQTSLEMG